MKRANGKTTQPKPIDPPPNLSPIEADEFRQLSATLQRRFKGFHQSDAPGLGRLIQLRGVWQKLLIDIAENGETFNVNGTERPRPQTRLLVQIAGEILKLERQHGLTPETRSRERTELDDAIDEKNDAVLRACGT